MSARASTRTDHRDGRSGYPSQHLGIDNPPSSIEQIGVYQQLVSRQTYPWRNRVDASSWNTIRGFATSLHFQVHTPCSPRGFPD